MGNTISYTTTEHVLSLGPKGSIKGLQHDDKARRYAGVPYALPPTGPRRWRKPEPLPALFSYSGADGTGPYYATRFRAICPQKAFHVAAETASGEDKYSEDCLFLNIWTPVAARPDGKPWPVKLWLHGGWFQMGDPSHEPGMDPTELISTGGLNAIVVAIGYRLNIFGFLAGEALLQESDGQSAGNFGLWDQRLAMQWVKENIALFGGDPNSVTLAGRSAGAYGVHAQMLHEFRRPRAETTEEVQERLSSDERKEKQLFHRVFMCSNAIPAQPKTLPEVQAQFDEVCAHFHLDPTLTGPQKLEKLRAISSRDLVAALEHLENHTFRPVTDELFVHSGVAAYERSGGLARDFVRHGLRLLIGEVQNEETLYSNYNSPAEPTLEALRLQLGNYWAPATVERVLPRYTLPGPDAPLGALKKVFGDIVADGQVRAPSRALVDALVAGGVAPESIWRYRVAYRLSFIPEKVAPREYGVAHAMDKPIWNFSIMHGPTAEERKLMQDWIGILVALVNDDDSFDFGTRTLEQMKVMAPSAKIEIQEDERWSELLKLGQIFASG